MNRTELLSLASISLLLVLSSSGCGKGGEKQAANEPHPDRTSAPSENQNGGVGSRPHPGPVRSDSWKPTQEQLRSIGEGNGRDTTSVLIALSHFVATAPEGLEAAEIAEVLDQLFQIECKIHCSIQKKESQ